MYLNIPQRFHCQHHTYRFHQQHCVGYAARMDRLLFHSVHRSTHRRSTHRNRIKLCGTQKITRLTGQSSYLNSAHHYHVGVISSTSLVRSEIHTNVSPIIRCRSIMGDARVLIDVLGHRVHAHRYEHVNSSLLHVTPSRHVRLTSVASPEK